MTVSKQVQLTLTAATVSLGICAAVAAEPRTYPDTDTERPCSTATESPECALKTFWMCTQQTVATCKAVGIDLPPDGPQRGDDGSLAADTWLRPWAQPWNQLLNSASREYDVMELRGTRDVSNSRIRGLRRAPRSVIGATEVMAYMVDAKGIIDKVSVFMTNRRGIWSVVAYARWRDEEGVNGCDRKKPNSLPCKYIITGMAAW